MFTCLHALCQPQVYEEKSCLIPSFFSLVQLWDHAQLLVSCPKVPSQFPAPDNSVGGSVGWAVSSTHEGAIALCKPGGSGAGAGLWSWGRRWDPHHWGAFMGSALAVCWNGGRWKRLAHGFIRGCTSYWWRLPLYYWPTCCLRWREQTFWRWSVGGHQGWRGGCYYKCVIFFGFFYIQCFLAGLIRYLSRTGGSGKSTQEISKDEASWKILLH